MSTDTNWTAWVASQADILNNIASNLAPVERLVTGFAYLMGLAFAFKAIYTLKSYGESKTMSASSGNLKEPIIYLLVAAVFIYFPTALAVLLSTTFGSSSILQYAPVNSSNTTIANIFGSNSSVGRSLTLIIQVIGVIAFVRGWILIARSASSGQPPGGTGKGFMHVFGGILAMNFVATLTVINNTLYGT
ncbi:MAG: type IV secretion protein IcmC [Proteobacteria bacterium]|nr:type IV secretion protein IcmC [Pseudomonadota bacterium]